MIAEQFVEALKKTSALPLPTASPTDVPPIPSVVPGHAEIQAAGDTGKKTLWVVFVLMVIASAAFTALSWRVPLVSLVQHMPSHLANSELSLSACSMSSPLPLPSLLRSHTLLWPLDTV